LLAAHAVSSGLAAKAIDEEAMSTGDRASPGGPAASAPLPPSQRVVAVNASVLAERGIRLAPGSLVLDFGCGSGRHVYEYRDAGYLAFGFDVVNAASLRSPEDCAFFRVSEKAEDPRLPFDDATFDLVYSTSVLEHVSDHRAALSEMARVLKPGGVSLHHFPSPYRPIEPHTRVPLAGRVRRRAWFSLWAYAGVRNVHQGGMNAREVTDWNVDFVRSGLCYPSREEIRAIARRYFAEVAFVEDSYIRNAPGGSRRLRPFLTAFPLVKELYSALHTRFLFLRKAAGG
jgi:SAM-dependent methyltransferase